jgi:hypothetical protein
MRHFRAISRRGLLFATAGVLLESAPAAVGQNTLPGRPLAPLTAAKTALVPFDISPFPYPGDVPDKGVPFLDVVNGDKRGHTSGRGGIYWEDPTYGDRRVLLSMPKGFDARRPTLMVMFFHGNGALLARDVRDRQQVPRQLAESGLNAVLVAPQFAGDALDSSAGRFWEPRVFARFLIEAAGRLARLHGNDKSLAAFERAPVLLLAYSGGHNPAAFSLAVGGAAERIHGVVLLDGLFGEIDKFADWIARRPPAFFVSAFTRSSRGENAELQRILSERGIPFVTAPPARLNTGSVSFIDAGNEVGHLDFVTRAWVDDPVKVLLRRVAGFARTPAR